MVHLQIILSVLFLAVGLLSTFYIYQEKKRSNHKFLAPLFILLLFHFFLLVRIFVQGYLFTAVFADYSVSELNPYSVSISFLNWLFYIGMLSGFFMFGFSFIKENYRDFKYSLIGIALVITLFKCVNFICVLFGIKIQMITYLLPILSTIPLLITILFLFYLLYYRRAIKEVDFQKGLFIFSFVYSILFLYSLLKNYLPSENLFVLLLNSTEHILFALFPVIWYRKLFKEKSLSHVGNDLINQIDFESLCSNSKISEREKEVLRLLLQGKRNKDIQETLFISSSTVKNHLYSIYRKLGVKSQTQLMHKYISLHS